MTGVIDIAVSPDSSNFKKYIPVLTALCCLISIVLFAGINIESLKESGNPDVYKIWGAPSASDIFDGSVWGLITSNFLHIEIWHIAFNLYWFWMFGRKIEFESGKLFFGVLILTSGLISSLSELAFSDTTGIGLSGIVYSFFGYIVLRGKLSDEYKNFINKKTIALFIFWLILCIVLTQTGVWDVANAGHGGGLICGVLMAYSQKFERSKRWLIVGISLAFFVSSVFWSPFSISWLSHRAYVLHQQEQVDEAILIYRKILDRDHDNEFAKTNLRMLEIHAMQKKAFVFHEQSKYKEARRLYEQILKLDSANEWAKTNMKLLPEE